jgi:hypothetical protein
MLYAALKYYFQIFFRVILAGRSYQVVSRHAVGLSKQNNTYIINAATTESSFLKR